MTYYYDLLLFANITLAGSVLQFLQSVFEKCYNLIKFL